MAEEIRALLIYEILGKPPEHIKQALEDFVNSFNEKPGIKLLSKKIHDPKPLEKEDMPAQAKDLYTTFAEVGLEIEDLKTLLAIILNTLPANVEILSPSNLNLKNFDLTEALNELSIKLHKYDEIAKVLTMERENLAKQVNELIKNKQSEQNINITNSAKSSGELKENSKKDSKEDKEK